MTYQTGRLAPQSHRIDPRTLNVRLRAAGRVVALLTALIVGTGSLAAAQATAAHPFTVQAVVAALRHGGLPIENLQRQPVGSSPSGPPATEQAAWGFTLRGLAHGDGRILLFKTMRNRDTKAA